MTRIFKPDSGQDLKLQNNGGTGSVAITDVGDVTIDSPGDIVLDAEGADIILKDGGTTFGSLKQSSGHLVFQPTSSKELILNDQGGTATLTVETSNQNVTVEAGNLVIGSAGGGIDFSACTGNAGAEILDDYEEGTWNPDLTDASSNSLGYSLRSGLYTKIGNTVFVTGKFTCNSLTGVTAANDVYLRGLPFTVQNTNGAYSSIVNGYATGMVLDRADQSVVWNVQKGQNYAYLMVWSATSGMEFLVCSKFSATGNISFSGYYFV